jgi:xanthine dehydrogenase accessory factor
MGKFWNLIGKAEKAEDPVCHMQIATTNPPGGTFEYLGIFYYFCGAGCRVAFSKEPDSYLSGEKHIDM